MLWNRNSICWPMNWFKRLSLSLWWSCHGDLENSNSYTENAFNTIYSNDLTSPSYNMKNMEFGCNVSKDLKRDGKSKTKKQSSWNMFVRKLSFPNAICFGIPFFVSSWEQFHECLDIWRRSYELWILVINAVADMKSICCSIKNSLLNLWSFIS